MPDGPNALSNGLFVGGSLEASLCSGHFVRNCSVHHSKNRGHVPHGSNGITYDRNVYFDIVGSALFLEEGATRRCVFNENHSILTRGAAAPNVLQLFDKEAAQGSPGPSAFWNTNPDNTWTNNSAGECRAGLWNSFSTRNPDVPDGQGCFGLSKNIPCSPGRLPIRLWENNEAYAFDGKGVVTDLMQGDEAGNVGNQIGFNTYPDPNYSPLIGVAQQLKRIRLWKGMSGGYQNRVGKVAYPNWEGSDICGTIFNGAAGGGENNSGLGVRFSLNVTTRPSGAPTFDMVMNSYHGELVPRDCIGLGYKIDTIGYNDEPGTNGAGLLAATGFFGMWSEYLYAETFWVRRASGLELLNSDFGLRVPPQHLEQEEPYNTGRPVLRDYSWDLAPATKDNQGYLGPAGYYWIFDIPFLTYGAANLQAALPVDKNNGKVTSSRFFGVDGFEWDGTSFSAGGLNDFDVRRLNPTTLAEVGHWTNPAYGAGNTAPKLGGRLMGAMEGGVYKILLPSPVQTYFKCRILGSRLAGNPFVFGVPFSGSKTAKVATASNGNNDLQTNTDWYSTDYAVTYGLSRRFTSASSISDLISGASNRFWQDKPNNIVWVKYEGGYNYPNQDPTSPYYVAPDTEEYDRAPIALAVSPVTTS
jgi:hypothetical protein